MEPDAIFANAIFAADFDEMGNRTCPHCFSVNNEPVEGEMLLSCEFFVDDKHDMAETIFPCGKCKRYLRDKSLREHDTGSCSQR